MAASSATHESEISEPQSTLVHTRNISTVSSTTHTSTTLHSQPYEPLLRPITPASGEYYDVASHQSRTSDRILSLSRWSRSNVDRRTPSVHDEKKVYPEERPHRKFNLLRWSKNTLQIVLGIWSLYCMARYLWAFTIYESTTGQAVSLALAVSTGLSFAFAACASFLYIAQTSLLVNGFSVHALVSLRSTLHYLSSCCLFGPSLVNLILILVWRKTSDLELQTRHRCRLDVDLVWSTRYSLCNHKIRNWGVWVTLSVIRLLITLIIIIAFHSIISSPQFVPVRRHQKSRYPRSSPRQPSDTTSGKSSPRNRLRPTRSRSSVSSVEGGQAPSYDNPDFIPMPFDNRVSEPNFTDRFLAIISHLTRETEEAIAFARSDGSRSSGHTSNSPSPVSLNEPMDIDMEHGHDHQEIYDNEDDDFYASSPLHNLSSNDYHGPHMAEEHIRMLNGYVRRMPTIESMGSREWRSSIGTSSQNTNRDKEKPFSSSRPPTRNARLSWTETEFSGSSDAHSRSNSLTAQAELIVGMFGKANASEVGELMRRGETIRMVDGLSANDDSSEALGDGYASTTSGSKDSYHTASSGSTVNSLKVALLDAAQSPLPILSEDRLLEAKTTSESH
ncbi:hypothetical protein CPB84DRAFT_1764285 [Gymnopilus junonius]|uniref:Uncharacterized protein n=1 Tax=Gymnopilus junonius TaxID=109634 RepID=A0A9P5NY67_GYMJU|nr:hypothetical protein CPB84DRAFT_1764285 [Gymnopilus junonius]